MNLIGKSYRMLLESQSSKMESKVRKLIQRILGLSDEQANDVMVDPVTHEPKLTQAGEKQTVVQYYQRLSKDMFGLFDENVSYLQYGVARIAYGELRMELTGEDITSVNKFKRIVNAIKAAHLSEYDYNLNGLTYQQLYERFGGALRSEDEADKQRRLQKRFDGTSNYRIVHIPSYDDATKYYKYTCKGSRWCLTHMENMWEHYTSNGVNKVYFALREGFENEAEVKGEGFPYDSYGLSMISVIVTPEDDLAYCTLRWNHFGKNGADDSAFGKDKGKLEDVVGGNFETLFKGYTKEELSEMGVKYVSFTDVPTLLEQGVPWDEIFDDYYGFSEGFAIVKLNEKRNYIGEDGKLLSPTWFEYCNVFSEGFGAVGLNGKWNYVGKDGKLLSPTWFDYCYDFRNGFATVVLNVEKNEKWNYIGEDGKLLSDVWFDGGLHFSEGFASVKLNGKWKYIGKDGKLLSSDWFDECHDFRNGFGIVVLNGKRNYIGKDGNVLSPTWFDYCYDFREGFACVKLNGETNYIDKDGRLYDSERNPIQQPTNESASHKKVLLMFHRIGCI